MAGCRDLKVVEIFVTWINVELLMDPIVRGYSPDQQDCSMRLRVYLWLNKQRDGMITHLTAEQRRRVTLHFETKMQRQFDCRDGERTLTSRLDGRYITVVEL
jgi:hypothetical protein